MIARLLLTAVLAFAAVWPAFAVENAARYQFDTEQQRERYWDLLSQLRCLVCQNESLADSQADLARDLREQIYKQMRAGKSNDAIVDYLVDRYGDFVLFRPPVEPGTYLLWFGPALIFVIGLGFGIRIIARRRDAQIRLSEEEHRRAAQLLDGEDGDQRQ